MIWLNDYLKSKYGQKIQKISIDAGFTCPNRDGSIGKGGCIFCSQSGSGDFAEGPGFSASEQIDLGKKRLNAKEDDKFIAYFQAFTNTYKEPEELRKIYMEVAKREDVALIAIATRCDCLGEDVLEVLSEINSTKPIWVELGLQTIHEDTAKYIRRGYELDVYEEAIRKLSGLGIEQIVTHVIVGLPFEDRDRILESVRYVGDICSKYEAACDFGIKLQLLHVLKGTDLEKDYEKGLFSCLSFEEYTEIIAESIAILPEKMIVHRITGDGKRDDLVAPLWSTDKKKVLNAIKQKLSLSAGVDIMDEISKDSVHEEIIAGHRVKYYEKISQNNASKNLPVFLYGISKNVVGDADSLFYEVKNQTDEDYVLISYEVDDWYDDFSPWSASTNELNDGFNKGASFGGNGRETLQFIKEYLIPRACEKYNTHFRDIKIYTLGYSLAGLFSLWAYYEERPLINGAVCCSGSLWFPGYEEYIDSASKNHDYPNRCNELSNGDILYLSLGGKEATSKNAATKNVGEVTKKQFEVAKKDSAISNCRYDINKGGHFADSVKRLAKGITYSLTRPT